jgi:phenylalanine-4-hydroxylase
MSTTPKWTGDELVVLSPDHPGFHDAEYRARRNAIAKLSLEYDGTGPVPVVEYTEGEHAAWREIWNALVPAHEKFACKEYKDCSTLLLLDRERIPQLCDVNERLQPCQGFVMHPVGGLIKAKYFLRYLGDSVFLSTQYVRHHTRPFYTPEPDIVHELIGHAATLADPFFAQLSRLFGKAAQATNDPGVLLRLERLYWFTLEFGVVDQGGPKAYGAGLLSSYGELERFAKEEELRPFDIEEIIEHDYDPTDYQSVLYVVDNIAAASEMIARWLGRRAA